MSEPLLSVCLVTYNQEHYIRDVLDGTVAQRCGFPIEIVIGEDHSDDSTRRICQQYAQQYPFVRLLPDTGKNMGLCPNFLRTYHACRGKYIAYLEGDDRWIDPCKLQKQVDILEKDKGISLVHTNCKLWDVATGKVQDHLIQFEGHCIRELQNGIAGVECEYKGHFRHVKTSTCVFRKEIMDGILAEDLHAYNNPGFRAFDVQLFLDMAYRGRFGFIDEDTTLIALADTLSASKDPQKQLDYRISYHKIGRYYIEKYQLKPTSYQSWLQREMHWFLNFGMLHKDIREHVICWVKTEKQDGDVLSQRQRILFFIIKHPIIRIVLLPFYYVNHSWKTRK